MKRLILLTLCGGMAFAGTGSIVASFRSPCQYVRGIDYHEGYIYHAYVSNAVYKTTTTGSLVERIPAQRMGVGIDRTNIEFWTCSGIFIRRLSTTGSVIRSINVQIETLGIAFSEGFLWFTGNDTHIYKLTVAGSRIASFKFYGRSPYGICWANSYLWLADRSKDSIFQVTTTGSFIDSFTIPQKPYGVTCEGNYIWYSTEIPKYVYKMYPVTSAVAPASLGKVKALYR